MLSEDYDAVLSDWIICPLPGDGCSFLAGRVTADRKGRYRDAAYITTSLVVSPDIADERVVQTLNSRYFLTDRNTVDDAIFSKLDAWLASKPEEPLFGSLLETGDTDLIGAYLLRVFRAATAQTVGRSDGGE